MPETYLTRADVMELLKISEDTLDRLIKKGMPHFRVASHRRFVKAKVMAWVEAGGADSKRAKRSNPRKVAKTVINPEIVVDPSV